MMIRKILITIVAAVAVSAAFVSCHRMDDVVYDPSNLKVNQYNAAFIQRYGEPAENHTWGFGTTRGNADGVTRSISTTIQFPGDAPADKFLSDVPEGVQRYDEVGQYGYASGVSYIENYSSQVNIWGGYDGTRTTGGTLYIKGNCDFSAANFYVAPNTDVFLLEGATLTLSAGNASNLQGGCNYYIAAGAKLVTPGTLVLNNGLHMYNHGVIEAGKMAVNNSSVFYNNSKVNVNGEFSSENGNSIIVNDGDITATRMHTAGSSHLQNNDNMTISGDTDIDSNDNTWVNNGHYTTGNFNYTAGGCDVINNCHLTVTNRFMMNLGETDRNGFQLDANCGVLTKDFEAAGPMFMYLGSNSVFRVTGTAYMGITKDNYGIYGPAEGEYAVFQAKDIVRNNGVNDNQGFVANYFQKLYVVAQTHFNQGYSDKSAEQQANGEVGSQPYYRVADGAALFLGGLAPDYTISETPCNPGFTGGEGIVYADRVICEDLGTADDFDFNDVAFDVRYADGGAYVKVISAGGIFPLTVGGREIHQMAGATAAADGTYPVLGEIEVEEFFMQGVSNAADIEVKVTYIDRSGTAIAAPASTFVLESNAGAVPQKIRVEPRFKLCAERQHIEAKYPLFRKYVSAPELEWY